MHAVIHVVAAGSEHTAILSGGTANVVKAALTAYDEAISVESTRYSLGPSAAVTKGDACSAWIGSVEHAEERCNEDSTCRYLYSHDSDGAFWHVCSSVVYDPTGDATTKIKPVRFWNGVDGGANPAIRDVAVADYTFNNGEECSMDSATTIGSHVDVNGECWLHSHPDEGNVYDMSRWTFLHPGTGDAKVGRRRNPIMKWAESGVATIQFPSGHPLHRWRDSRGSAKYMQLIGKLDDEVEFSTLPDNVQTAKMAEAHGVATSSVPYIGVESCGSRGEVANEPALSHRYTSTNVATADSGLDQQSAQVEFSGTGKWLLWGTVVTHAPDQLRQRVAWALSQILVVGEGDADKFFPDYTESWATYYDVFVAHAFGNYKDIMREVAASPFMGEYLSMRGNVAFSSLNKHPDENFAREIMQLFSIGLWELNSDGTPKIDPSTGQYINAYTNEDIMAFARVWTGWDLQPNRGNIMSFDDFDHRIVNLIDPMLLKPEYRDRFPKRTLRGKGHLGDGYVLCSSLAPQHYLHRGAKYVYHGPISMYGELHDNHDNKIPTIREHFVADASSSQLYQALCGADKDGRCTFPAEATLDADLACSGSVECNADILRAVKIEDGNAWGYYTYVEPPCVRLQFFDSGRTAMNNKLAVCADPAVASNVGAQCCEEVDDKAVCPDDVGEDGRVRSYEYESANNRANGDVCRSKLITWSKSPLGCKRTDPSGPPHFILETDDTNSVPCHLNVGGAVSSGGGECLYVAEPMKFATAQQRCAAEYQGGAVCDQRRATFSESTVDGQSPDWQETCAGFMLSWTNDPCTLQVQVFPGGDVAVVDRKGAIDFLKPNAANRFRVLWGESMLYPTFEQNCTTGCQPRPEHGGTCICDLSVENTAVVLADPDATLPSEAELRARLQIGSTAPVAFVGEYTLCTTKQCTSNPDVRVHTRGASEAPTTFGADAIFEFVATAHTHRPSVRKPARFLLNTASIVHVGSGTVYKMLQPTTGIPATCMGASSERSESEACGRATDSSVHTEWATDAEQAGAWIVMEFDRGEETIDRMVYANRCGEFDRNKVVQLEFSDGTMQNVTVANHCDLEVIPLESSVTTSTVKLTVVTAYQTTSGNNGARMIRFLPAGAEHVSTASITPCEDSGLLPLSQSECEIAAAYVQLPPGQSVGRGGVNTVLFSSGAPQKCSLQETDFSPHWNARQVVQTWETKFRPLCKVASGLPNQGTGFQFRNPPHFVPNTGEQANMRGAFGASMSPYGGAGHLKAAAEYETEALVDHLFEHHNTAPFVATRMIQRLVGSNPTPRFVEAVATAFQTGSYGGKTYSGEYGDMAALTAAIMLDREARSSVLDTDPSHGQMREPVLKVMHLLRALEYKSHDGMEINLYELHKKVGQFAFQSPTVFNFYLPEFSPAGPIQEAGLVAPEAQISTGPFLIGFLNGVSSLVDNGGLTSCARGFGGVFSQASDGDRLCNADPASRSDGVITLKLEHPTHPQKAVDELALLLTGGRLGPQTRTVLTDVYTSYLHDRPFGMDGVLANAIAVLDNFMVAEAECSYAAKQVLGIPVPVAASCKASSEQTMQHACTNALDSHFGSTQWNTQSNWEGPPSGKLSNAYAQCMVEVQKRLDLAHQDRGNLIASANGWGFLPSGCSYKIEDNRAYYNNAADGYANPSNVAVASDPADYTGAWINVTFDAGKTLVDRMAWSNANGVETVSLEFSDGSTQTVTGLPDSDVYTVFNLAAVSTSSVKISFQSVYRAKQMSGARAIHFYQPGGADFNLQGQLDLSSGSWADRPKGCSYHASDQGGNNAAYFNSHDTGCGSPGCGDRTSVLAAGYEDALAASQSSRSGLGPYAAVDGKTGFEWNHIDSLSCVQTTIETSPWFKLDLGSVQNITTVHFHARRCDGGCDQNGHGFSVYLDNTVHATNVTPNDGEVIRFDIYSEGQVIKILNPGDAKVVTFCELEVNVAQPPNSEGYYPPNPSAEEAARKHALKLLAISPDFHATNVHAVKQEPRKVPEVQVSQGRAYKAVVVLFLAGGADSFNIVVPHGGTATDSNGDFRSDCKKPAAGGAAGEGAAEEHDLYAEYQQERGPTDALAKSKLLEVDVTGSNQPCATFGLHPSLKNIHALYNDGDAALVANMGGLVEPITLEEWNDGKSEGARKVDAGTKTLPPGLFGHNVMQKNAKTVHAANRNAKGVLGRMVEKLTNRSEPLKSALYSIGGLQSMLTGAPFAPHIVDGAEGVVQFRDYGTLAGDVVQMIGNTSRSLLAETYAAVLEQSIKSTETFGKAFGSTALQSGNTFASGATGKLTHLARAFRDVAKVIQLDNAEFETERSVFYTQMGGFDTHKAMNIDAQLNAVDEAVGMLADELKQEGVWDNVTIVCVSDFGRTLRPNSRGTDHGWGGNYWVVGGAVKGGTMLGKYPARLAEFESDRNVGRGRFIPTTPWEGVWNAVGSWFDLDEDELEDVLPHKSNFAPEDIFRREQLFEA